MKNAEKFRDEILAFQIAQRETTRWKIIGCGVLAAFGLGIQGNTDKDTSIILCVIPFFAPYCDLICCEYEIRIALLGSFLAKNGGDFSEYEQFINSDEIKKIEWWRLTKGIHLLPSLGICLFVLISALSICFAPNLIIRNTSTAIVLSVSSAIGVVLVVTIERNFVEIHQKILSVKNGRENIFT